ncbi:MAG: 5'/3'-nucleotidase SurE [Campylobacterota bacterium]|nr:5'/3'-nucleotidase SurE [Campylobacterota bacterium]
MSRKKVLITNDDGFNAKGLKLLCETIKEIADVVVVAPAGEKSACGHSLTLNHPLKFISVDDDYYKLEDGTPSDCIYLAINTIFEKEKPDLIISGINRGSNMGEDITYSGTCAGAMEGVLHNIPSIAISQVVDFTEPHNDYTLALKAIKVVVEKIFSSEFPLNHREFLNINIPMSDALHVEELKFKTTYAGYRYYANDAHLHRNPRGEEYYWLGLHPLEFKSRDVEDYMCDFEAIENGFISITPIQLDLSAYKSMKALDNWI